MSDGRRESFEAYLRTLECDEISRRSFLKLLGASIALAGIEGCTRMPAEKILPYVNQPEFTPGVASHYATAMVLDGYASGVLVESHDGRPTKIEGNPDHPASLGAAGIFEQASLLQLYAPHRAKRVRRGNATSTWRAFTTDMVPASLRRRVGPDGERLRLLMEPTSSPLEADLLQKFSQLYPAAGVHFYTPLGAQPGAEPFRAGSRALVHQYDFQKADVILSVGADFLARGPFHLRYARQFAERRRPESAPGGMNRLYAIEASLTVTGAAADHRLAVRPSEIDDLLEELLALVANSDGAQPSARIPSGDARSIFLHALARDLGEHRGRSVVIGGLCLKTGFGYAFDFAFATLFAALCIPSVMLGVMLLLTILRKLPRAATGIVIGCCVIVMMLWGPPELGVSLAIAVGLVEGVLGATIATFVAGGLGQSALRKKILVSLLFVGGVAGNVYFVWLLTHTGSMEKLITWKPPAESMPAKLALENPSANGPFHVQKLFYGVGNDIRRPEFGASVAIKTRTLDASDFFKDFIGYITSSIYAGLCFVIVSFALLLGYLEMGIALRHYTECLWIATFVAALSTFLRATRLLARVF